MMILIIIFKYDTYPHMILILIFTAFLAGPSNNTGSTSLSAQNQNHNGYARPFQVARLKL